MLSPLARITGSFALSLSLLASVGLGALASADSRQAGVTPTPVDEGLSVIGRLVAYDAQRHAFTIRPDRDRATLTIEIPADVQVCRGARCFPPIELARLTGRRLKVRYRAEDDGRLIARVVTVERPRGR
ncbi:MAG: hypothetical protein AB7O67_20545 [Vicinamibacterales bacterium]